MDFFTWILPIDILSTVGVFRSYTSVNSTSAHPLPPSICRYALVRHLLTFESRGGRILAYFQGTPGNLRSSCIRPKRNLAPFLTRH